MKSPVTFEAYRRQLLRNPAVRREYRKAKLAIEVAHQIVQLREKLKISQAELARRMGTKQQTISRLEKWDYDGFTFKTLMKIAKATKTRLVIRFQTTRHSRTEVS